MTAGALYEAAVAATARAHPPYSDLHVGAVLEAADGTVYEGGNVEFASYGLTICAERVALVKAVSDGHRAFRRIGVARSDRRPISPCGACRQALADFGLDLAVVYLGPDGIMERPLRELLPDAFHVGDPSE
jgi:cytidine deaminase